MDWKRERDLLIAQTLAFVQSVAGKKADVEATPEEMPGAWPHVEAAANEIREIFEGSVVEPPKPVRITDPVLRIGAGATGDFRTEIQARVTSFRAHQQRFDREREEYFSATLAKARAKLQDETVPNPLRPRDR